MKHYKWTHDPINNTRTRQMKPKLSIFILLTSMLLSLPFVGCGKIFVYSELEYNYKVPDLPKSELATIQIDTESEWIRRPDLILFLVDGKVALREKIEFSKAIDIDEVLVLPGKHNMSLTAIYEAFHERKLRDRQISSAFSVDVKAGGIYLLRGEFSNEIDGELGFQCKLVDTVKDKVVSEPKLLGQFTSDLE